MKNLKNKDDLVNFNIFKLIVKNSLHLVWTPCNYLLSNIIVLTETAKQSTLTPTLKA